MTTLATAEVHELDAGPRKAAPGAERLCAATGAVKPIDEMIRFVLGPDGGVVPDVKRKLPGRGLWITATRQALERAVTRNIFARGFRREVKAGRELVESTERLFERAALDSLGMAHKAGRVAAGFGKADNALAFKRVAGLIHAADAAPDGKRKLDAAVRRRDDAENIAIFDDFTTAQLDLALGRPNVVHAALLASRESDAFVARARWLRRFRTQDKVGPTPRARANESAKEQELNG